MTQVLRLIPDSTKCTILPLLAATVSYHLLEALFQHMLALSLILNPYLCCETSSTFDDNIGTTTHTIGIQNIRY